MQLNLADFGRFIASVTPWPGTKQRSPSKIWSKICTGYNNLLPQSLLSSWSWWQVLDSDYCFTCPDAWRFTWQLAMYEDLIRYVTLGYSLFRENPMKSGKDEWSLNQLLGEWDKYSYLGQVLGVLICQKSSVVRGRWPSRRGEQTKAFLSDLHGASHTWWWFTLRLWCVWPECMHPAVTWVKPACCFCKKGVFS